MQADSPPPLQRSPNLTPLNFECSDVGGKEGKQREEEGYTLWDGCTLKSVKGAGVHLVLFVDCSRVAP
ncbi:hypothetical protein MTO96_030732 [Rhipicephalus appendiculatus]